MGYKPKYAAASAPARPTTEKAFRERQSKRRNKASLVLFVLLTVLLVPAATLATGRLLLEMFENVGRPKPATYREAENLTVLADFDAFVEQQLSKTREALLSAERPDWQTEVEPVRKLYWIEEGTLVAPEPDQSCYGEADSPAQLQWLLDKAKWILEGQDTYFTTETQIYEDSNVRYYLDDSIFAVTWKEVHEGSVYTFSEVKVSHPSQFRRHLAGGEFGSEMQYYTTEMAADVNAVVASAGDFYRFRDFGISVYESKVHRVEGTYAETCLIDDKGDLHFVYGGEILDTPTAQAYVDEHNINFSLAFGPVLVDDYEIVEHTWYGVGEIKEGYARAALCQMDDLHYIVATANTTGIYQDIPTVATFARHIAATGCRMAYSLDGGQTATIVMNDQLINRPVYGEQRKISDIIYFATAVPEGG